MVLLSCLCSHSLRADTLSLPPAIKHGCAAQLGEPRMNILGGNAFGTNPSKEYYPNLYLPSCTPDVRNTLNKMIRFGQEACLGAYGIDLRRSSPDGVPRFAPDTMNDTIALAQIKDAMAQYKSKFTDVAVSLKSGSDIEKKCSSEILRFENTYAQSLNEELNTTAEMIVARQTAEITASAPHTPYTVQTLVPTTQAAPAHVNPNPGNAPAPVAATATSTASVAGKTPREILTGHVLWSGDMSQSKGEHYFFFESSKEGSKANRFYAGRLDSYSPGKPISYNSVRAFETTDQGLAQKIREKEGTQVLAKYVADRIREEDKSLNDGSKPKSKFGNYPISLVINESFGFIGGSTVSVADSTKIAIKSVTNPEKKNDKKAAVLAQVPAKSVGDSKFDLKTDPANPNKKYFIYDDPASQAKFIGAVDLDASGKKVEFVRVYPISADDALNYKKLSPQDFRVTWNKVKEERARAQSRAPASEQPSRPDALIPALETLFK